MMTVKRNRSNALHTWYISTETEIEMKPKTCYPQYTGELKTKEDRKIGPPCTCKQKCFDNNHIKLLQYLTPSHC